MDNSKLINKKELKFLVPFLFLIPKGGDRHNNIEKQFDIELNMRGGEKND